MFNLTISKQQILAPLLTVAAAVDKKQAMAILANVLLTLKNEQLFLTATDLEIQITAYIPCPGEHETAAITVPAKKMVDIIRSLDDNADVAIAYDKNIVSIRQGRSQFKLATLPADNYPNSDDEQSDIEFTIVKSELMRLLQGTHFAMSQQDVRVFLNGLLFEITPLTLTTVAMDGHRMAVCRLAKSVSSPDHRLVIPRKGVQEIMRLLNNVSDEEVVVSTGKSYFRLATSQFTLTSRLLETRFPPYVKAIPKEQDKHVILDRDVFKKALSRISILAHEKSRAVLLHLQSGQLTLIANNQEQEEAVESIEAQTQGDELKIGVNAGYLLDVLNHVGEGPLKLSMSNMDCSILVESLQDDDYQYIIMPMKI